MDGSLRQIDKRTAGSRPGRAGALAAAVACAIVCGAVPVLAQTAPAPAQTPSPTPAPAQKPAQTLGTVPVQFGPQRFYVGGAVGYAALREGDIGPRTRLELNGTVSVMTTLGMRFRDILRAEVELGYRNFGVDTATVSGAQVADAGTIRTFSGMANAFVDLGNGRARPYFGLGLGLQKASFEDVQIAGQKVNGDSAVFAWQAIAGLAYALSPRVGLTLDYRYIGGDNPHVDYAGGRWEYQDLSQQIVQVGLRYGF